MPPLLISLGRGIFRLNPQSKQLRAIRVLKEFSSEVWLDLDNDAGYVCWSETDHARVLCGSLDETETKLNVLASGLYAYIMTVYLHARRCVQ